MFPAILHAHGQLPYKSPLIYLKLVNPRTNVQHAQTMKRSDEHRDYDPPLKYFKSDATPYTLLDIPTEVAANICSYIPMRDMYNVCMTCSSLGRGGHEMLRTEYTDDALQKALRASIIGDNLTYLRDILDNPKYKEFNFLETVKVLIWAPPYVDADFFNRAFERSSHTHIFPSGVEYADCNCEVAELMKEIAYHKRWNLVKFYMNRGYIFTAKTAIKAFVRNTNMCLTMFNAAPREAKHHKQLFDIIACGGRGDDAVVEDLKALLKAYRVYGTCSEMFDFWRHKYIGVTAQIGMFEVMRKLIDSRSDPVSGSDIDVVFSQLGTRASETEDQSKCISYMFSSGYLDSTVELCQRAINNSTYSIIQFMIDSGDNNSIECYAEKIWEVINSDKNYLMELLSAPGIFNYRSLQNIITHDMFRVNKDNALKHLKYATDGWRTKPRLFAVLIKSYIYTDHAYYKKLRDEILTQEATDSTDLDEE